MKVLSFDTETHLIEPGILAPKLVVGAFYSEVEGGESFLLYPDDTVTEVLRRLEAGWYLVGANIFYDFGVLLHHAVGMGRTRYARLRDEIFKALDEGRVWDVQIAEALYAIAQGHLRRNPDTGEVFDRYSLAIVLELTTGRKNAKEHDEWRLRYGELDGLPIEQWPEVAQVYPIDDVKNTQLAYQKQAGRGYSGEETNLHDLPAQCRAAWAMHLGAIWGFNVDQEAVNTYERDVVAIRGDQITVLTAAGVLRTDGSRDTKAIARRVVEAHSAGARKPCAYCQSTGQTITPKVGKRGQSIKPKISTCSACGGVGLEVTGPVPRTETGKISISRDTLFESGDETLLLLGKLGQTDKAIGTYIPYLRQANGAPLTLSPNVLLETGRASYSGVIQLLPRQGRERECFVARPGYVFYSVDYEGLELAAHAQSCLNLFGESKLADVLNAGGKPHDMLAAKLYGKTDEEFARLFKAGDRRAKDLRQSAKPANFGFPGFMGAVRLVLQQREQGPDTTGPDGTVYHGLRFCILMGYASRCGEVYKYEHNDKPISPTCVQCIEAAQDLRSAWMLQWPENRAYFDFILDRVERVGYIKQHVSNRVRGKVDVSNAANGFFQSLAADGAKRALYAVVKAQYCDPESPVFGSRNILFAHDELLGEAPIERASEVVEGVTAIMIREMRTVIPDVVIRAEPTLMTRWYKQATCVRDANGRVIPWEPHAAH